MLIYGESFVGKAICIQPYQNTVYQNCDFTGCTFKVFVKNVTFLDCIGTPTFQVGGEGIIISQTDLDSQLISMVPILAYYTLG